MAAGAYFWDDRGAMFTDSFEIILLSAIVQSDDIAKKSMGVVGHEMFSSAMSSDVFAIVKDFYKDYKRVPSQQELSHLYDTGRVGDNQPAKGFIDVLYTQKVDPIFVIAELNNYVKNRKLEALFRKSFETAKSGDGIDIASVVSDLFRVQLETVSDKHIYGVSIDDTKHLDEQQQLRCGVPTNISYLNRELGGALYAGQLGTILAPSNYGKTMMLLNFAIYAFLKQNNVLFVTLEMPEFSIMRRIMMLMSGFFKVRVDSEFITRVVKNVGKKFVILYRPTKTLTVDYLYSVYHQAEADGIKFDAIYIDYADLLRSDGKYKERRFELSEIFYAMKSLSQILQVPVWTATQSNREGFRADTVRMEHTSESIDKVFASDVVLSLNDKMDENKMMKLFLTKVREGRSDRYVDVFCNDKLWFEDGDELVDAPPVDLGNV